MEISGLPSSPTGTRLEALLHKVLSLNLASLHIMVRLMVSRVVPMEISGLPRQLQTKLDALPPMVLLPNLGDSLQILDLTVSRVAPMEISGLPNIMEIRLDVSLHKGSSLNF